MLTEEPYPIHVASGIAFLLRPTVVVYVDVSVTDVVEGHAPCAPMVVIPKLVFLPDILVRSVALAVDLTSRLLLAGLFRLVAVDSTHLPLYIYQCGYCINRYPAVGFQESPILRYIRKAFDAVVVLL